MPAPLAVNRGAVRVLALAIGVREAARQMNIAESTVQSWSERERWFPVPVERKLPISVKPVERATIVRPADVITRLGESTKLHLAQAGAKASKHLAKLPGKKIVTQSGDFKNVVGANAQLHGWDTRFQGTQFSLNVLNLGAFGVDIDAS